MVSSRGTVHSLNMRISSLGKSALWLIFTGFLLDFLGCQVSRFDLGLVALITGPIIIIHLLMASLSSCSDSSTLVGLLIGP